MKNRNLSLDFCRVATSICVVLFHFSCHTTYSYKPFSNILNSGFISFVNFVFFIVSGFSLYTKYNDGFDAKKFYIYRFKKIYPLFWFMQIIFFLRILIIAPNLLEKIPYYSYFLSVLGLDGYLSARVGSIGFAGDWYIGLQLLIYLIYPLLCKANRKLPFFTLVFLSILYVVWFKFNLFNISIIYLPMIFGILGTYIGMMLNRYKNYIFNKSIIFIFALVFVAVTYILVPQFSYVLCIVFYTCVFICFYFIGENYRQIS